MKVFIDDRGRNKYNSGYSNLSRNFGRALRTANVEVIYNELKGVKWHPELSKRKVSEFEESASYGRWQDADIALTIGAPAPRTLPEIRNVAYTQNGLGGLKRHWAAEIAEFDAVVLPGKFDVDDFKPHNANIHTCPQLIDNGIFVNRPKWREEGDAKFTYIFIGSLSFRKGVDLLLEAFCKFSIEDNNQSKLILICPGSNNINFLLKKLRQFNPAADVDIYIQDMAQEWICRYVNRSDVFITLSRGEGWCMPLFESILAEKPCIIPDSTAMSERSPDSRSIIKIPVSNKEIDAIDTDFGRSCKQNYGGAGIVSYDVAVADAVKAMQRAKSEYSELKAATGQARKDVLENYSYPLVGEKLKSILAQYL